MKDIIFEYGAPMEIDKSLQLTEGIPLEVSGVAVDETLSYNDIFYEGVELEKSASTLIGKPLLKDHKNEVDSIVGRVREAKYNPETKQLNYGADVMDEHIKEMIKDGRINTVSIGARVRDLEETESDGKKIMKAKGLEFMELSVVAVQGVPNASLQTANFLANLTETYRGVKMGIKEQEPVAPLVAQPAPVAPPVAPAVPQVDKVAQLEQQIALIMQEIERLKQVIGASTPTEKVKEQEDEDEDEEEKSEEPEKKEERTKVKHMGEIEVKELEQKVKTLQETVEKLGGIKGEVADVGKQEETLIVEKGSTGISFYDKKKGTAKNYKEFLKG